MSSHAKTILLKRIKSVELATGLESLIDKDVTHGEHNATANLLRKGMGIVSFNILEDFFKSRTREMFDFISSCRVRFDMLPDRFQTAATQGALKALIYRVGLEKKNNGDWLSLIHDETKNVYSTSQYPFTVSSISMLSDSSNISPADIPEVLKCLNITGGWSILKTISDAIGGGVLDLNEAYKNMFNRRHHCAHEADFIYQYTWLNNAINDIIAISAAFDIALTTRCKYIERFPEEDFSSHSARQVFGYRFLVEDANCYREKTALDSDRTIKRWDSVDSALNTLLTRVRSRDEFLIVINQQRRICDWYY